MEHPPGRDVLQGGHESNCQICLINLSDAFHGSAGSDYYLNRASRSCGFYSLRSTVRSTPAREPSWKLRRFALADWQKKGASKVVAVVMVFVSRYEECARLDARQLARSLAPQILEDVISAPIKRFLSLLLIYPKQRVSSSSSFV